MTQDTNPNAGLGIGVVQPQSGLDYPFVSPGLGKNSLALDDVEGLFADFYFSYDDPGYYKTTPLIQHPLRIHWLYGFGDSEAYSYGGEHIPGVSAPAATHMQDLLIVDANNVVVFDSTTADVFNADVWGAHYTVYEWIKTTKPGEAVCRAVVYNDLHTNETPPDRPLEFLPRNAVLDERAVEKIPKRVLAMRVENNGCVTPWFKEKVSLFNGFNTVLEIGFTQAAGIDLSALPTAAAELARINTDITLSAEAESGKGQFGLCTLADETACAEVRPTNVCPPEEDIILQLCNEIDAEDIKQINGIGAADGNLFLNANDCLYLRQPTIYTDGVPLPIKNTVELGADCPPCCACQDYVDTAVFLTSVASSYAAIGRRVETVKTIHEENITRWEAQRACRIQKPLRLYMKAQPCPCIDATVFFCNHCETCLNNVVLTLQLSSTTVGKLFLDYSDAVEGNESNAPTITGGWPVYGIHFDKVDVGASVYATLRFCLCATVTAPESISGTLTGVSSAGPILAGCEDAVVVASATNSVSVDC